MKRLFVLLIGTLIISMVFTGCGTPVETPADIESKIDPVNSESNQDLIDAISQVADSSSNVSETSHQKESSSSKEEKIQINEKKENSSNVVEKEFSSQIVDKEYVDDEVNPSSFTNENDFQCFLKNGKNFSNATNSVVINTNNNIAYYRPSIPINNNLVQLVNIEYWGQSITYFYRFCDDNYEHLTFEVSCYLDDSFEENYLEAVNDLEAKVYGYVSANVNNHQVLYRDTHHGTTAFIWQQFGGYMVAFIKGDNHADKVQEVLPYLNLEKVTLRTDLETQ